MSDKKPINLTGIPETMLWTLHNRAQEAGRSDRLLLDPECLRIYQSLDYDFERSFGKPDASHPCARVFSTTSSSIGWRLTTVVVELGAGLETQFQRCDDGQVQWVCVDVPEALAVRDRFLPASERCRFVSKSALDPSWLDQVDPSHGVFVTAQGLLMYFEEAQVQELFVGIVERFAGVELMFDTIPPWFSKKTLAGYGKTKHYRAPPMPLGRAARRHRTASANMERRHRVGIHPELRASRSRFQRAPPMAVFSHPWPEKLPADDCPRSDANPSATAKGPLPVPPTPEALVAVAVP